MGRRLTLNATVNPDFGQVEVDPAVVNLSDVESSFEEKRPYFVEGASNFRFGREGRTATGTSTGPSRRFFYSRRIGRAPQGALPPNEYSRRADRHHHPRRRQAHREDHADHQLRHAAGASPGRTDARYADGNGIQARTEVEPAHLLRGDARARRSSTIARAGLGLISTAVVRRFQQVIARERARTAMSFLGGLDGWYFLDPKQKWVLSGWAAGSNVQGTSAR